MTEPLGAGTEAVFTWDRDQAPGRSEPVVVTC
jgi:hypothetical protein